MRPRPTPRRHHHPTPGAAVVSPPPLVSPLVSPPPPPAPVAPRPPDTPRPPARVPAAAQRHATPRGRRLAGPHRRHVPPGVPPVHAAPDATPRKLAPHPAASHHRPQRPGGRSRPCPHPPTPRHRAAFAPIHRGPQRAEAASVTDATAQRPAEARRRQRRQRRQDAARDTTHVLRAGVEADHRDRAPSRSSAHDPGRRRRGRPGRETSRGHRDAASSFGSAPSHLPGRRRP